MTRRLLLTVVLLGITGAVTVTGTYAAFSGTTASASNQFTAGSVSVSDGHAAATPISITDLRPGSTVANCIAVRHDGSVDADLRQYVTTSGALIPYVQLKVTRGSGLSAGWPSCTGFGADGTNYIGQGNGVVYNGALASFPTSSGGATLDPTAGSPEAWSNLETHAYQYEISLTNTAAAQGLSGSMTITWEAQNL
jgi:predicted ribosomally synthesized peptide with SipW-like signal peptide